MKQRGLLTSLLIVILSGGMSATRAAETGRTRDPAYSPFDATSPWNMPIGDKAQYGDISSEKFDPAAGGGINCGWWSLPIFIATAQDPIATIYLHPSYLNVPEKPFITMHVPVDAQPDPKSDAHLNIIDETHSFVLEMLGAVKDSKGKITATWSAIKNDLRDAGVYDAPYHGSRAYGGSGIAGLIRQGELTHGIPHALAAAIDPKAHNRNGPGGKAFVWPASSADGDSSTAYGTTGNLFMGTLVAIPPSVDLGELGLRGPEMEIARALQDYGAYVVDSGGCNFQLYAEPKAKDEVAQVAVEPAGQSYCCLRKLVPLLRIVTNNTPQSVGGGGKPRGPLAPPFAEAKKG